MAPDTDNTSLASSLALISEKVTAEEISDQLKNESEWAAELSGCFQKYFQLCDVW